jgi:hypothetical protein
VKNQPGNYTTLLLPLAWENHTATGQKICKEHQLGKDPLVLLPLSWANKANKEYDMSYGSIYHISQACFDLQLGDISSLVSVNDTNHKKIVLLTQLPMKLKGRWLD